MQLSTNMGFLILEVVLQLGEGVFFDLPLRLLIADPTLIGAILGLKDPLGAGDIDIVTIFRVCPDYESLYALGALHSELVDLRGVEVADPSFDGVEPDSLGHHVVAALTAHVEGSLVSDLAAAHPLAFDHHEGLLLGEVALARDHFGGVEVLGPVEVVGPGCGQSAHTLLLGNNYKRIRKQIDRVGFAKDQRVKIYLHSLYACFFHPNLAHSTELQTYLYQFQLIDCIHPKKSSPIVIIYQQCLLPPKYFQFYRTHI